VLAPKATGTCVEAVRLLNDEWIQVRGGGWMLLKHPEHGMLLERLAPCTIKVMFSPSVALRSRPGLNEPPLCRIDAETYVEGIGQKAGWVRVGGDALPSGAEEGWLKMNHPTHGQLLARMRGSLPMLGDGAGAEMPVEEEEREQRETRQATEQMQRELARLKGEIHRKQLEEERQKKAQGQYMKGSSLEMLHRGMMAGEGTVGAHGFAIGGDALDEDD